MNFRNRSFLKLLDYTPEEINALVDLAVEYKKKKQAGKKYETNEELGIVLPMLGQNLLFSFIGNALYWGFAMQRVVN